MERVFPTWGEENRDIFGGSISTGTLEAGASGGMHKLERTGYDVPKGHDRSVGVMTLACGSVTCIRRNS